MKRFLNKIAALTWVVISLTGLSSCSKKRDDSGKSDLSDAGYKLTPEGWFKASRDNDPAALKKFLSSGFQLGLKTTNGDSALHVAASAGAQKSAKFLLDRGVSVDVRGGSDRTPLMSAVIANQTNMVGWLLRQGVDPRAKDKDGYTSLMLAVREGSSGSVAELAPYNRDSLDAALLLAALIGRADVIDSLTNYGASVYARMEDGRTALMVAAENGNKDAVGILLDLGASRYAVDPNGHTALDLAKNAGHEDIVTLISKGPVLDDLSLDSPEKLAEKMNSYVESAQEGAPDQELARTDSSPDRRAIKTDAFAHPSLVKQRSSPLLAGEILSRPVERKLLSKSGKKSPELTTVEPKQFVMPPLVMRSYRERELPINVESVQGDTATIHILGPHPKRIKVRVGETIPGSRLMVVSHDPVALVEDSATGKRYIAKEGQRFKGADGSEFIVSDVRPNQLLIKDVATGAIQSIPLSGPRG
jgi:hypothetical protein